MRTGALIVAAGMSSRMGAFKPMLKIGSISAARRIIFTFQQAGAEPVVVITGNQAETLERHVARQGVICLRNPDYATTQMLDSAKIGLQYLLDVCDQVLFSPVDIPLFTAETASRLMDSGAEAAIPVCRGAEGHPLLLSRRAVETILDYGGDGGLRGALSASGTVPLRVSVEDEGVLFDADTPEDFHQLLAWHNTQMLRRPLSVWSWPGRKFF